MVRFLGVLKTRNAELYYFGWGCLLAAVLCIILIFNTRVEVLGINAWIKPFKFFISSTLFSWSMGWYMSSLKEPVRVRLFSWVVIIVLSFETIYIAIQAGLGELSHFNNSSPFHEMMFGLMGLFITVMTIWTAYIGWLFFRKPLTDQPLSYVWSIRIGIILFVIFALEGGLMGQHLAHTVGAPDGGAGWPLVNWSKSHGDLRVAHFMGMHGLQVIPLVSHYLLRTKWQTLSFGLVYLVVTAALLVQALMGHPFIRG